jgi:hypothetical protein
MSFYDCEGLYKTCTGRESDLNNVLAAQHVRHVRGEIQTSCVRARSMVQGSSAFRMSSSLELRFIASVQLRRRVAHFGICLRSRGKSSLSACSFLSRTFSLFPLLGSTTKVAQHRGGQVVVQNLCLSRFASFFSFFWEFHLPASIPSV